MDSGKYLTLRDIFAEMNRLKIRAITLKDKLKLTLYGIKAITWKDIIVFGGYKNGSDIMVKKVIKADGTREELEQVIESYNSYKELAISRLAEMMETEPAGKCITYFRDNMGWKWEDIAKLFNYSDRHCRRLYDEYRKNKMIMS